MNRHDTIYICMVSGRRYRLSGERGYGPGLYRSYEDGEPPPQEIRIRDQLRDTGWRAARGAAPC